jgi:hypothetical protein
MRRGVGTTAELPYWAICRTGIGPIQEDRRYLGSLGLTDPTLITNVG